MLEMFVIFVLLLLASGSLAAIFGLALGAVVLVVLLGGLYLLGALAHAGLGIRGKNATDEEMESDLIAALGVPFFLGGAGWLAFHADQEVGSLGAESCLLGIGLIVYGVYKGKRQTQKRLQEEKRQADRDADAADERARKQRALARTPSPEDCDQNLPILPLPEPDYEALRQQRERARERVARIQARARQEAREHGVTAKLGASWICWTEPQTGHTHFYNW